MGWSIGFDGRWNRDIGYGVPAYCDHPGCEAEIDRGLGYVCGAEPYGGDDGCGLYFCGEHTHGGQLCERCADEMGQLPPPFDAKPDHPRWIRWKLTDNSWAEWRVDHPGEVARMQAALQAVRNG